MIAAIDPMMAANTASAPRGFSSHCFRRRSITLRNRGVYTDGIMTYPGPLSPGRNSSSQCLAFQRFHHPIADPSLTNGFCESSHSIGGEAVGSSPGQEAA